MAGDLIRRENRDLLGHSEAVYDRAERYRYLLIRRWLPGGPTVTFLMLNPSTATEDQDDPTIRRCISYARREGGHALTVVNLFACRAKQPQHIPRIADPVGPRNDEFILTHCQPGRLVVAAWGLWGEHLGRGRQVEQLLTRAGVELHCLGLTAKGLPRHPLYLRTEESLQPYRPAATPAA